MRVLKKKLQKDGRLKELKERQYFTKPSMLKREAKKRGIKICFYLVSAGYKGKKTYLLENSDLVVTDSEATKQFYGSQISSKCLVLPQFIESPKESEISNEKKNLSKKCLFINPSIDDIKISNKLGVNCIEIHTGKIANLVKNNKKFSKEFMKQISTFCVKYKYLENIFEFSYIN